MKYSLLSLFVLCFFSTLHAQQFYLLIGTYDSPTSEGIYSYEFNSNNSMAKKISHIKTSNPSFLTVSPDNKFVYAVHENGNNNSGGEVAAFAFDNKTGSLQFINQQASGGDHPCHVTTDKTGRWVFTTNYTSGSLSVLPVNATGGLAAATSTIQHTGEGPNLQRQKGPHTHSAIVSADNKYVIAADLGIDKLLIYRFNDATGKLTPGKQSFVSAAPGSGPRHFIFDPTNQHVYLLEELSGNVVHYKYKKGKLKTVQTISSMAAGETSFAGSADIHISLDGKFLYSSNRSTVNNIAIFSINPANGNLTLIGHQPTLGKTPRNFSIDPTGNFLLVANQNSDEIVIFKRDTNSGMLTDTGNRVMVGKPVCLKWIEKN